MADEAQRQPAARVRWNGPVPIVDVQGEISWKNRGDLKLILDDLLERQAPRIIVNLTEAQSPDDALITLAIELCAKARKRQIGVGLFGLNEQLRHFFAETHVDQVIPIHDSEAQALDAGGNQAQL